MKKAPVAAAAAFLALALPAAGARVSLVLDSEKNARAAAALAEGAVRVRTFDRRRLSDPAAKRRFLADIGGSGLIVSASRGRACSWLSVELANTPLQCLSPFNGPQLLDYARRAGWKRVAVIYGPGYARVFARLHGPARARGLELLPVSVARPGDLPAKLPGAAGVADALWLLDAALDEGAPFDYIIELSLTRRLPLVASENRLLSRGAFLAIVLDDEELVRHAVSVANAAARGEPTADPESPPGRVRLNEVLARHWGLRLPGDPR